MVLLVDPQRLHGNPFRSAIPLLAEIVPGSIRIGHNRAGFGIDLNHAEARTNLRGWRRRKHPALGRNTDTDESEIVAELLHGLEGRTDFTEIPRFDGVSRGRESARNQ